MRARRSTLAVPGNATRLHASADRSAADEVFLDLEDAVAPADKTAARATAVRALETFAFAGKTKAVRVNAIDSEWHEDDVREVVTGGAGRVDCLIVPKVESADAVRDLDRVLTALERRLGLAHAIGLELQIESARGLDRVSEIASASRRAETLVFGPGDLAASLGMPQLAIGVVSTDGGADLWQPFLARIVVAARANGLQPIDGPYADLRDERGLAASARRGSALGCDGKWAVHPGQLAAINDAFTPSQADVDKAAAIIAALADGQGVARLGDEMIDAASARMAEVVLTRARGAGMSVSRPGGRAR